MKTAIILGVCGLDGSLLADLLISKGYKVVGVKKPISTTENISHLLDDDTFDLVEGDITSLLSISFIIQKYNPEEVYNLAGVTSVGICEEEPLKTFQVNVEGVLNCLESIRLYSKHTKFFTASSSMVYGRNYQTKQSEFSPCSPCCIYGTSKLCAEYLVKLYRKEYGMFACYGRLFNHIHPRQSPEFVVKKICNYVFMLDCLMRIGSIHTKLKVGNIDALIDVSSASDVVEAIYLMMQMVDPIDLCIGSGQLYSIEEIIKIAFSKINIHKYFDYIDLDPKLYRTSTPLCADTTLIEETLGWKAETSLDDIIGRMVRKTF